MFSRKSFFTSVFTGAVVGATNYFENETNPWQELDSLRYQMLYEAHAVVKNAERLPDGTDFFVLELIGRDIDLLKLPPDFF